MGCDRIATNTDRQSGEAHGTGATSVAEAALPKDRVVDAIDDDECINIDEEEEPVDHLDVDEHEKPPAAIHDSSIGSCKKHDQLTVTYGDEVDRDAKVEIDVEQEVENSVETEVKTVSGVPQSVTIDASGDDREQVSVLQGVSESQDRERAVDNVGKFAKEVIDHEKEPKTGLNQPGSTTALSASYRYGPPPPAFYRILDDMDSAMALWFTCAALMPARAVQQAPRDVWHFGSFQNVDEDPDMRKKYVIDFINETLSEVIFTRPHEEEIGQMYINWVAFVRSRAWRSFSRGVKKPLRYLDISNMLHLSLPAMEYLHEQTLVDEPCEQPHIPTEESISAWLSAAHSNFELGVMHWEHPSQPRLLQKSTSDAAIVNKELRNREQKRKAMQQREDRTTNRLVQLAIEEKNLQGKDREAKRIQGQRIESERDSLISAPIKKKRLEDEADNARRVVFLSNKRKAKEAKEAERKRRRIEADRAAKQAAARRPPPPPPPRLSTPEIRKMLDEEDGPHVWESKSYL